MQKRFFDISWFKVGVFWCLCCTLAMLPQKVAASTVRHLTPSIFNPSGTFRLGILDTFEPGTAVTAAGPYDVDISTKGLSTASYSSRSNTLFSEANVAEGSLKVSAESTRIPSNCWGAAAAIVDQYSFSALPQDLKINDLQLRISYEGYLDNRWSSLFLGVIGDHGQKAQLIRGPKEIESGEMIIPLTTLVLDPTNPFTLGIAAVASTQGKKGASSFENTLFIEFLANGVPIETTSTGGFHQSAAAPLPHSLVLFSSAIVGLITFRKRSRIHRLN